jgi:hypothetical protein
MWQSGFRVLPFVVSLVTTTLFIEPSNETAKRPALMVGFRICPWQKTPIHFGATRVAMRI